MKDIVTVNAKDMRAARTGTGSAGNEFLNTSNIVRILKFLPMSFESFLIISCQPSTLDTFEVVFSLCDLLEHLYRKFVFPSLSTVQAKNIVKLDARFKVSASIIPLLLCSPQSHSVFLFPTSCLQHHILCKISKDMSNLALSVVKQQMTLLDKNLTSGWEEAEDDEAPKNK